MSPLRLTLAAFALYLACYATERMAGILYHDQYGFFRAPWFGRYHIAPLDCSRATTPSMLAWYAFLPLHVVEHRAWRAGRPPF